MHQDICQHDESYKNEVVLEKDDTEEANFNSTGS